MKTGNSFEEKIGEKEVEDFVSESDFIVKNTSEFNRDLSFESRINNQKLEHDEKDHKLKLNIASFLKWLLLIQSTTIFVLVFLQGFKPLGFDLQDYTILNILVAGVLTESYFLVRIIVEHLFPKKDEKQESLLRSLISKIKN